MQLRLGCTAVAPALRCGAQDEASCSNTLCLVPSVMSGSAIHSAEKLADLHRHLDGSLRYATLVELLAAIGRPVPNDLRFYKGMGLEAALACFETTLAVLQTADAIARVANEICEDAHADGVTTLELRFAPQLHGDRGLAIDAALDGIGGRAGLILCGLYGEDPAILSELVALAATRPGVVGIDIAGGPNSGQDWKLSDYAPTFAEARAAGLGRTVHASEGRPPHEIQIAIELLHAQRIGHGTTLLEDPKVLALVLEQEITLEACPTSNVQTGAIATIADHPLKEWLRSGVRACVCTDNPLFSNVTASSELQNISYALELTDDEIAQVIANGHAAAFPKR